MDNNINYDKSDNPTINKIKRDACNFIQTHVNENITLTDIFIAGYITAIEYDSNREGLYEYFLQKARDEVKDEIERHIANALHMGNRAEKYMLKYTNLKQEYDKLLKSNTV